MSNTGRKRVNIHGALNINAHKLISVVDEQLNGDSFIELLKKVKLTQKKNKRAYFILDNAGYHKSEQILAYIKKNK